MKNWLLKLRENPRGLTIERRAVLANTASLSIVEPRVFGAFQKPIFHVPWV